jgi:hypothetical protein
MNTGSIVRHRKQLTMHMQASQSRPRISAPLVSRAIALVLSLGLTYAMWSYAEQQSAYWASNSAACSAMEATSVSRS